MKYLLIAIIIASVSFAAVMYYRKGVVPRPALVATSHTVAFGTTITVLGSVEILVVGETRVPGPEIIDGEAQPIGTASYKALHLKVSPGKDEFLVLNFPEEPERRAVTIADPNNPAASARIYLESIDTAAGSAVLLIQETPDLGTAASVSPESEALPAPPRGPGLQTPIDLTKLHTIPFGTSATVAEGFNIYVVGATTREGPIVKPSGQQYITGSATYLALHILVPTGVRINETPTAITPDSENIKDAYLYFDQFSDKEWQTESFQHPFNPFASVHMYVYAMDEEKKEAILWIEEIIE